MSKVNRIEIRMEEPNPLFRKWLTSWLSEAIEKNSKARYTLREALESLKRFPLPLGTGRECAILRGFGPKLCNLLDEKLEEYKKFNKDNCNKSLNYAENIQKVAKKYKQKKIAETNFKALNIDNQSNKKDCKISNTNEDQIIMSPGYFHIVLLVDTQETTGKSNKVLDETRLYLDKSGIKYEIRRLSAGDFCWICRDDQNHELMLPYIIERKRMDDFASSIRDGRFHEQKFRLKESGVHNLIYMIENYGNNQHVGLPMTTLMQAATNTQIHNGFQIKFTDGHRESMLYLTVLTELLANMYKDKVLIGTPKEEICELDSTNNFVGLMKFQQFNEQSAKNKDFHVKEMFIKQLLQLKSLSLDKAIAITRLYPTPKCLILAYDNCSSKEEKEKLLANIPSGKLKRPVGIFISRTICQLYNNI